jgi:EpsI family protein
LADLQKRYWLVAGLLTATIIYRHLLFPGPGPMSAESMLQGVPYRVGPWYGVDQPLEERVLDVLGLDAYLQRRYADDRGNSLWLYVGYYLHQRQGKGIHSPKHCYPGAGWSMLEKGTETVFLGDQGSGVIKVNRILFQKDEARQIILYWFQSADRIVQSEYAQRFYLIWDAIGLGRTDGALVKVSAPVGDDASEALDQLKSFIRDVYPFLSRSLSNR